MRVEGLTIKAVRKFSGRLKTSVCAGTSDFKPTRTSFTYE